MHKENLKIITFSGDFEISIDLLLTQLIEIQNHFDKYAKGTEYEDTKLKITFEEGSFILSAVSTLLGGIGAYYFNQRFIKDYVKIKKLEKSLINEEIKDIEYSNNDDEEIVRITLSLTQEKITISKKAFVELQNTNNANEKKKIARRALRDNRKITYVDITGEESVEMDVSALTSIAEGPLISEKISKPREKRGVEKNTPIYFKGVSNNKQNDKYFEGATYKGNKVKKIEYNQLLDGLDLNNDFTPTAGANGPIIICDLEYEYVIEAGKAHYNLSILKIHEILRPEGSGKQIELF